MKKASRQFPMQEICSSPDISFAWVDRNRNLNRKVDYSHAGRNEVSRFVRKLIGAYKRPIDKMLSIAKKVILLLPEGPLFPSEVLGKA